MRTKRAASLTRIGWAVLSTSAVVPLVVSLFAVLQIRDMRCTSQFSYTFAPLLVTCGDRSVVELVLGWTLTAIAVGGLGAAVTLAILLAWRSIQAPETTNRFESWTYVVTVAGVLLAVAAILATDPDRTWGSNSWIFFSSSAAALVLIVAFALRSLIKLARNRGA